MFPGGIERYQWHNMGQQPRQVCPLLVSKFLSRKEIHAQSITETLQKGKK